MEEEEEKEEEMNTNSGDVILRQPEQIVQGILSHLDYKDLARTSILSKSWRNLWITLSPALIFDSHFFDVDFCGEDFERRYAKREVLMDFAEQSLRIRRHSHHQTASLECLVMNVRISHPRVATSLDNCIRYATECNVKHLQLKIRSFGDVYVLPPTLFAHKSLTVLNLSGCKLESSSFTANMNMPSLKMVYIWLVCVDSVQLLENLISSCPVIESLSLAYCFGSKGTLKISGLVNNPKLVDVEIDCCKFERVEIESPGLRTFSFRQDEDSAPCEIVVSTCINMRELRLYDVDASTITNKSFDALLSRLSLLETLILRNCNMVETIKISSCCLKSLEVCKCMKLVKVEIDDPNLSLFSYTGDNVISFSSNALDLSINISLYPSYVDTLWFVKLIELLGRFNTVKVLTLNTNFHKNVIVPQELRESLLPPLYNVEHLILDLDRDPMNQAMEEIIDGLLWLSPHPMTVSIASFSEKSLELTFLYNEIDREGSSCCCFAIPITCWRHCSKEVKVKSSGRAVDEVERNIKSFLEHAKLLKKIDGLKV